MVMVVASLSAMTTDHPTPGRSRSAIPFASDRWNFCGIPVALVVVVTKKNEEKHGEACAY